jgi:hypothetical protein
MYILCDVSSCRFNTYFRCGCPNWNTSAFVGNECRIDRLRIIDSVIFSTMFLYVHSISNSNYRKSQMGSLYYTSDVLLSISIHVLNKACNTSNVYRVLQCIMTALGFSPTNFGWVVYLPPHTASLTYHMKSREMKLPDVYRPNRHSHTHTDSKLSYILINHSFTNRPNLYTHTGASNTSHTYDWARASDYSSTVVVSEVPCAEVRAKAHSIAQYAYA